MDPLIQDQEFFAARLAGYDYFADITVLQQQKGVLESDIEQALSTLNEQQGKLGAVVIVLKPVLVPTNPDTAGPGYRISQSLQVITQPLYNDSDQGTKKDTAEIAGVIRQLGHRFATPNGLYSFAGMQPEEVEEGKDSYSVTFTRLARDAGTPAGLPLIDPEEGDAPQTATITSAAADEIWVTTDGSYPSPRNENARQYLAPIEVTEPATLYAVAYKAGCLPSGISAATFT